MKHTRELTTAIFLSTFLLGSCDQNKSSNQNAPAATGNEAQTNTASGKACYDTEGLLQSPVNITTANTQEFNPANLLSVTHRAILVKIAADVAHKNEYNIKEAPMQNADGDLNCITFRGGKYSFAAFHFHAPSEHWDNGRRHDMEVHVVFQKSDLSNERIIIGTYLDVAGPANPDIDKLWAEFKKIKTGKDTASLTFDISSMTPDPNARGFYSYPGSLTSEPYHEGALWIVSKAGLQISAEQLSTFKSFEVDAEHIGHARDTFAVGNRIILISR